MKNKKERLLYLIFGVFFLISFILFTLIVKSKVLDKIDFNATVRIQNHLPKKFDTLLSIFSLLGSFEILMVILVVLLLFRKKLLGLIVALIFLIVHVLEIFAKAFLYHPGPPFSFFRYNLPFFFPSASVKPGSSYPSGHSFRSVFIFIITAYIINQTKKLSPTMKMVVNILLFGLIFLMLFSRISLGEHWLTDVIGGSLLGTSFGIFSLIFL